MTITRFSFAAIAFVSAGMWPVAAGAGVISFTHPDLAATRECSLRNPAPLELVEHGGVRVDFYNPIGAQNKYPCDDTTPVYPTDWPPSSSSPWRPLLLNDSGLRPMTIWAADDGWFQVTSMTGAAILGFTFNAAGSNIGLNPCSLSLRLNGALVEVCNGANQFYAFAEPLYLFRVDSFWAGSNPQLQLLSVTVPEPASVFLLVAGAAGFLRRRYS